MSGPNGYSAAAPPTWPGYGLAAADDPLVADAVTQAASPAEPTSRQRWICVSAVVVVTASAVAVTMYAGAVAADDCRTARNAALHINAHRKLLDPKLIGPHGPELANYRAWSDRLQQDAER